MEPPAEVGIGRPDRHRQARPTAGHVLDPQPTCASEGQGPHYRAHRAGIRPALIAEGRGEIGFGGARARQDHRRDVGDRPALECGDRGVGEAELLALARQLGQRDDVLADRGSKVPDVAGSGHEGPGHLSQRTARHHLTADQPQRRRTAAVQRPAGVRVHITVGKHQAGAGLGDLCQLDAETAAVGRLLHPVAHHKSVASRPEACTGRSRDQTNPTTECGS